ncbi:MAG: hypothetical protein KDC98_15135 [Planctomycetes bacterium]|nr:hypothetical protein [Planctomycetota bacterium]
MVRAPAEGRERLRTIQDNGSLLLTILNDVLDLSKIEAGKLEVERLPVDVVALARSVIDPTYAELSAASPPTATATPRSRPTAWRCCGWTQVSPRPATPDRTTPRPVAGSRDLLASPPHRGVSCRSDRRR